MSQKSGRNDPCPCGSGKKYKHCCGQPAVPEAAPAESHQGAIALAMGWLAQHHRKGFAAALQTVLDDAALEIFDDDEEQARAAVAGLDKTKFHALQINLTEWLLAEGDMQVKGQQRRVVELLLSPDGPLLSSGQRAWLEQLASRPLRLYDVTGVVPGVSITVRDALASDQAPVVVNERAGSQSLQAGMQVGARLMEVNGQHQFSGAAYPFTPFAGGQAQARLSELAVSPNLHEEDDILMAGLAIIECWLAQLVLPDALPEVD
jgi:SEC-C motif